MARLRDNLWTAIRTAWEFDSDGPTYNVAASRASEMLNFDVPAKTTIASRAKKEGWERRGNLNGINAAAQSKADKLTNSDASPSVSDGKALVISDASETQKAIVLGTKANNHE